MISDPAMNVYIMMAGSWLYFQFWYPGSMRQWDGVHVGNSEYHRSIFGSFCRQPSTKKMVQAIYLWENWRWVREEASLLDGDLDECFNGVASNAAVIRQRASLPWWSSSALACLELSSEIRQPSQAQQHHQNALLQARLIFCLLRSSSVKNTAPLSSHLLVHTFPSASVYLSNTSALSRWSSIGTMK